MSLATIAGSGKRRPAKEKREAARLLQFFLQIQTAAEDGQNGSAAYALDRLALIRSLAAKAIERGAR